MVILLKFVRVWYGAAKLIKQFGDILKEVFCNAKTISIQGDHAAENNLLSEVRCSSGERDEQEMMWERESGCWVRVNKLRFIYLVYSN